MSRNTAVQSTEKPQLSSRSEIDSVFSHDPFTVALEAPIGTGMKPSLASFSTEARESPNQPAAEDTVPPDAATSAVVRIDGLRQDQDRKRIFRLDQVQKPRPLFRTLAAWQGEVVRVENQSFVARLHPDVDPEVEEVATFEFDEVESGDVRFVRPGVLFSWHVGEHTTEKRQVIKGSILVFRRMPAWSKHREARAREAAEETVKLLGWDDAREETGSG